jgi:hypothetical protein
VSATLPGHGVDGDVLLAVVDEDGVDEVGGSQNGLQRSNHPGRKVSRVVGGGGEEVGGLLVAARLLE